MTIDKKSNNKNIEHIPCAPAGHTNEDAFLSESWVQAMENETMPTLLHESIMKAVEQEKRREKMKKWSKRTKWVSGIAAAVVIVVAVSTGLNNGGASYKYASDEMMTEAIMDKGYADSPEADFFGVNNQEMITEETTEAAPMEAPKADGATTTAMEQRKIIQSADIYMETLAFDTVLSELQRMVTDLGGYIESSQVSGRPIYNSEYSRRSAWYTLRIPVEHFTGFVNDMQDVGNVISKSLNGTDITASYFDTEARLDSLTLQEERLLAILEKAEKLEDVIELERELSDVRYQIESMTGTLRRWDNLVDYATVTLTIDEVRELQDVEPEPETWGQRIVEQFKSSIESLIRGGKNGVVAVVGAVPYIIVIALIAGIVIMPLRKIRAKRKDKKQLEGENEDEK
jgi:hypothetical protein